MLMDVAQALERLGGVADAATLLAATSRRKVRKAVADGDIVRDGQGRYALPHAERGRLLGLGRQEARCPAERHRAAKPQGRA